MHAASYSTASLLTFRDIDIDADLAVIFGTGVSNLP
jgi:hypothetical protein